MAFDEIGKRGGWGKWLLAQLTCPVLVAYVEPKLVLLLGRKILQCSP